VTERNPVRVGRGPKAERAYLGSLRGPKGEAIEFKRLGSCCAFKTPNAWVGETGLLDRYEITYAGLEKPMVLYLDMYDHEKPFVPAGLTKAP